MCPCLIFVIPLLYRSFFSKYYFLNVAGQNLILLDCFQVFNLKDQTNWVSSAQNIGTIKLAQVNWIMMTLMLKVKLLIQLLQASFQLRCGHKYFNYCCKENTLKAQKTEKCFSCTCYQRPRFTVTSLMQWYYIKKSLKESEIAISSNLDRSNL